ncbi:type II toxin-antitoxin system VapC family toxin [Bradyrhizobium sp. HKCCYLR20261]|uniref:type II toxin-antitoxin system VapC family toxin n=1 Tax=unclassified Bradyrhizobium TaxID=2631580 RepID=UPI003EB6FDF0
MIIIDTNVISEVMRPVPASAVLGWFAAQDASELYLSAVSEAELRVGVAVMPSGKRREALMATIDAMIDQDFAGRILPFDSSAAKAYAAIAAVRRALGRPIMDADCQIAAIAQVAGAALATRNVADFNGCGLRIINPWQSSATSG